MKEQKDYIRDIAEIRSMMERSSKFLSLSGWAGIMAGLYALSGAYIAYSIYDFNPDEIFYGFNSLPSVITLAIIILILAVSTAMFLSYKKSSKRGEGIWNAASRQLLINMAVPLLAGGILIFILIAKGLIGFVIPLTLLFYGLALFNAGKFTYNEVKFLGMIRDELVEEEKWISREQFNRTLAVYQALPGPEAHELCVYFGMVAGGRLGGFLAGLGFMLPGFVFMLILTWFYFHVGIKSTIILYVLSGFHIAALALITRGTHRISQHSLVDTKLLIIAIISAIAYYIGISFFIVLPAAGLVYYLLQRKNGGLKLLLICIVCFSFLTFSLQTSEEQNIPGNASSFEIFFSGLKAGLLTFGGAYTAIPFLKEDAVQNNFWMTNEQFLDGIALSGILPAPLIIFSTFVGYFAGGWSGALIITAGIFLPAFCFTLLGHKYLQKLIDNPSLHHFLDGVTASVIGFIAITAIKLLYLSVSNIFEIVLLIICIIVLYLFKSKYSVVYVIFGAGLFSFIYLSIINY